MARGLSIAIALVMVLALAAPVQANGLYLGGGLQSVAFSSDLEKWFDFETKIGASAVGGIRFSRAFALEVVAGQAEPDEASFGTTTYTWIEVGPKFIFGTNTNIRPSVTFGVGEYTLDINIKEFEGQGGFIGFGIEEIAKGHHSVGFFVRGNYWLDDDDNLDVITFSMLLNYTFLF